MLVREIEAIMSGFVEDSVFKGKNTPVVIFATLNGKKQYLGMNGPTEDRSKAVIYLYDDDNVSDQLRQCAFAGIPMKCEAFDQPEKPKGKKKAKKE